jgi:fluoroacetyl-CoA thioesterase
VGCGAETDGKRCSAREYARSSAEVASVSSFGSIEEVPRPPEGTLAAGIERTQLFTAEGPLLTNVGGTIAVSVLSTPGMIAMIEGNCTVLALEHLPEGKATVGFEVCVKHVAGALQGTECETHAVLREFADGRKLRFDVEVRALDGDGGSGRVIGLGTHERRLIDIQQHSESAGG